MNSVTGVLHLMSKFKVGQKVKIMTWQNVKSLKDIVYVIKSIDSPYPITLKLFSGEGLDRLDVEENILMAIGILCPVCEQEVETENSKIKEHKHNNELCYGSYIPIEL